MRRPGGDQIIPRPPVWEPGDAPPWSGVDRHDRLDVRAVTAAVAARGPGRPPTLELDEARHSAVLVALVQGEEGAEVLLTRRSWDMRTHRGEISFPGGRIDPGETPVQAAVREAWEEVGLDTHLPRVVGELDHHATAASRNTIVPVVAELPVRPALVPASVEVDRVLFVPLTELLRADTYHEEKWGAPPFDRPILFFELDDETIWGATARILAQLLAVALGVER